MTVRADVNMGFYTRFLIIGLAALGFAGWSLYDGAIGYPNQRERALKYEEFKNQEEFETKWVDYARGRNWPLEDPGEPKSDFDIQVQYIMAALAGAVGAALLTKVGRARGRWIEGDQSSLRSSWGQNLEFDQVTRIDKRQWKNKGIAKVLYEADGRKKKFVIDDFKFARQPTGEIIRQLEDAVGDDKITGGPPEPTDDSTS